jgi:hypothetical protein
VKSIVWRVAAGDEDKDLVPMMIREQVMLIGPGSTGSLANASDVEIRRLPVSADVSRGDLQYLVAFRWGALKEHIVVLRLGSVCFSVGAITSDYFYNLRYDKVYSSWNPGDRFHLKESTWDLRHARKVNWYGLTDEQALCFFRKGIYGGAQRFCRVGDGGKEIAAKAKKHLDEYLCKLGYNNANADEVLKRIGEPCVKINRFGFPTP